ncbi:MAG: type II toxin-antitoxin system PemK/MazF family toxin [Anaerolineales bacterium]|nr:type II toxin-antitoxin system PemK/MazF family toxin [Anaerolineales bacterium]MCL4259595.1 type II toxin-antitoxin system PemK/MazF family toxin [Anaerolineales bacterium]
MGAFVKGDVVVTPFPYSDLTASKKRPALVVASLAGDDVILCQITSQQKHDEYSISLVDKDFKTGALRQDSFIRPNRVFTTDSRIVLYKAGTISAPKIEQVIGAIISILNS